MKKKATIFITISILIGLVVFLFLNSTSGKYYQTYSPDKQYSVYASKNNSELFSMQMPGGSGDASGKVFLYDEIEKKVINSAPISMVSMASNIRWIDSKAYFVNGELPNSIKPWKLPRPIIESKQKAIEIFEKPEEKIEVIEERITADIIDLEVYVLGSYHKDNKKYIPFASLTDMFNFKEHKDSTVIADKYLAEDNLTSHHTLSSKYRARFLKQKQISENDSVFIYDYGNDKLHTYLVREIPILAHVTEYAQEAIVPQFYYLIGFNFENIPAFKNWTYSVNAFIHIGKNNPFNLGQLKPFKWKIPTEIPKQILEKDNRTEQIDIKNTYTFLDNEMKFFYFPTLQKLFVLNAKTNEIVYNKWFFSGEGASLAPLNYMDKNYPNEHNQWTGKLFKDYPTVFFGFAYWSFGCEQIDVIQPPLTIIPILCDNRH